MKKGIIMEVNKRFLTILTPEGEFLRAQRLNRYYQIGQEIDFVPVEQEGREKSFVTSILSVFKGKIILPVVLAVVLMVISIIPFYQNNQVYAYMSIDINPSIELGINKNYKVIELIPYNEDGKKIINQLDDWKEKDARDVTSEIIHEIKTQGYMKNNQEVLIGTVYTKEKMDDKDTSWNEEIDRIKAAVHSENLNLTVVEGTREEREKAKEEGLTTGLYKENSVNVNKLESEKGDQAVTVPQKEKEEPVKETQQKEREPRLQENQQKEKEKRLQENQQKEKEKRLQENQQKEKEKPIQANPQNQKEMPPKANPAKQKEAREVEKDQNAHIPPGQLKKQEKADQHAREVKEEKTKQIAPTEQEKINKHAENSSDKKEQKAKPHNRNQDKSEDSAKKKQSHE